MALKITDLRIDSSSLGTNFMLVDCKPAYAYENGNRTERIEGYRYYIALPAHKMEKIGVKVSGNIPLVDPESDIPIGTEIEFDGLEIGSYFSNGQVSLSAKATGVRLVKKNEK